jgi:hypothetical protein
MAADAGARHLGPDRASTADSAWRNPGLGLMHRMDIVNRVVTALWAKMHIRHGGDMVMNKGKAGDIAQLFLRSCIDIVGPDFDGDLAPRQGLFDRHGGLVYRQGKMRRRTANRGS